MSKIEKLIIKVATEYHGNMVELNRLLYIIGIRSYEKAEEVAKKHMMTLVKMLERAGYDISQIKNIES